MKYMAMAFGVGILGMVWSIMACPAFSLFMMPCLMFSGIMLYLESKGEFDE